MNHKENIARCGISIMGVFAEAHSPSFGYTIGMTETHNAPELLMFGLPVKYYGYFFNEIAKKVRDGLKLEDDTVIDDLATFPMVFRTITPDAADKYVFHLRQHYDGTGHTPSFMQVVIPDANGVFPWDEGYDESVRPNQPDLWKNVQSKQ